MHFSPAITALLTLTLVSASPIERRTTATVLSDASAISTDVANLDSDVIAFTGNIIQALTLATAEEGLNSKIVSSTTDIQNTPAFDTADSTSVTSAANALTPKIVTVLDDLKNKASVIAAAGLTSTFLSSLQTLKTSTGNLFVALESKVDSVDVGTITADQATVIAAFNAAISAF